MNNTDSTQGGDLGGGGTGLGGYSYYGIGISVAVLAVFLVVTYFSYKCKAQTEGLSASAHRRRLRRSSAVDEDDLGSIHIVIQRGGLDAAVISTFPLYTYAQLKPHKGAAGGCAVCLGDYKDSEAVRLLPECGHVFHRSCIDPWLMIHPTCPICRNSPLKKAPPPPPSPPPLAEAQPTPVANQ